MATVYIGHASGDENRAAHGGQAGDQTGTEVCVRKWYKHSKGWRLIRATSAAVRDKIASAMEAAADNANIGYDQYQRDTLLKLAAQAGFDVTQVNAPCETDCSALVRVCVAHAMGRDIVPELTGERFYTGNMCRVLLKSGEFSELTGAEYTDASDRLMRGDILCTRTQGHTVVVLNDGENAALPAVTHSARPMLRRGDEGEHVRIMQTFLHNLGYDLGRYGVDGDFGADTLRALKTYQEDRRLEVDGICGAETWRALAADNARSVVIVDGNCWVRTAPNATGEKLGVAKRGEKLRFGGLTSDNGWHLVVFDGLNGWVSGRYGKLEA